MLFFLDYFIVFNADITFNKAVFYSNYIPSSF